MKHRPETNELQLAAQGLGVTLSAEAAGQLLAFEHLLRSRAIVGGFVAAGDEPRIRERHILDCLRATAVVDQATTAYDLGSGAGLPGIVVAISSPGVDVGLVETRRRRVAFLELVVRELGLPNARVIPARAQDVTEPVELCLARAFAPLPRCWEIAEGLLKPGGRLAYFAGREAVPMPVPAGVRLLTPLPPVLESGGPLVIMTRQ